MFALSTWFGSSLSPSSSGWRTRSAQITRRRLCRELPAAAAGEVFGFVGPPAALGVGLRGRRVGEERGCELPHALDAVSAREQRLVADQRIVEETLVRGEKL